MPAISPTTPAECAPALADIGVRVATTSLAEAVDYETRLLVFLGRMERATARRTLDRVDAALPPSHVRDAVREAVLDNLAWYREQVKQWLDSASHPTEAD